MDWDWFAVGRHWKLDSSNNNVTSVNSSIHWRSATYMFQEQPQKTFNLFMAPVLLFAQFIRFGLQTDCHMDSQILWTDSFAVTPGVWILTSQRVQLVINYPRNPWPTKAPQEVAGHWFQWWAWDLPKAGQTECWRKAKPHTWYDYTSLTKQTPRLGVKGKQQSL